MISRINDVEKENFIVIISEKIDMYVALEKQGFQNVIYFDSVEEAETFFSDRKKLNKCSLIITPDFNNTVFGWEYNHSELSSLIGNWYSGTHVLLKDSDNITNTSGVDISEPFILIYKNNDLKIKKISNNYNEMAKKLFEYLYNSDTKKKITKEDLKILFVIDNYILVDGYIRNEFNKRLKDIKENLGLNVEFKTTYDFYLDFTNKILIDSLTDYDIIIGPDEYTTPDDIKTELYKLKAQCPEDSKDCMLLMYYDYNDSIYNLGIGSNILLKYGFFSDNDYVRTKAKSFSVLTNNYNIPSTLYNDYLSFTNAILMVATNIYSEISHKKIENTGFKTADDIQKEFNDKLEEKQRKLDEEMKPIREFDSMVSLVKRYLDKKGKSHYSYTKEPEGLKITEENQGIKLEMYYGNRILCTMVVPYENRNSKLRIFKIQTMSKKGNLSEPISVGIATEEFKKLPSYPKQMDENQLKAYNAMLKKVNATLPEILDKEEENKKYYYDNKRSN